MDMAPPGSARTGWARLSISGWFVLSAWTLISRACAAAACRMPRRRGARCVLRCWSAASLSYALPFLYLRNIVRYALLFASFPASRAAPFVLPYSVALAHRALARIWQRSRFVGAAMGIGAARGGNA
jgi:hypothetical protein